VGRFVDWLLGPEVEVRSEQPPEQPPQGSGVQPPKRSEAPVTDDGLLSTINVYRAAQLLGLGVGQLTLDVWRGKDLIDRPSLIRKPDVNMRLRPFLKMTTSSLALNGNCYWQIKRNDRGEPTNITVLKPLECEPQEDGTLSVAGLDQALKPNEFRHLGLLRIPGRLKALGPIQAARLELTGAVKVTKYGSEFFQTGDVPSGVLKTDQVLSPGQADDYKKRWAERQAHEVAVLGQGLSYEPMMLSPEDAQFIATRQFDTTATARLFGIPARLFLAAVEGGSATYANLQQDDLQFVRWTLSDYLGEIEDAFSGVLPGLQEARFNLDGVLRPDTKTRYEAHKLGIDAGWLLKSEVRDIEGLPPKPGIDKPKSVPVIPPASGPGENEAPKPEEDSDGD
jgi:HK97 family phage portal protein